MSTTGTIKLQCVSCHSTRDVTMSEAAKIAVLGPICPSCGMPEVAIRASVRNNDIKSPRRVRR